MIREIKCLCIRTLARIIPAAAAHDNSFYAKSIEHRRVEVTVERETVSILVPLSRTAAAAPRAGWSTPLGSPGDLARDIHGEKRTLKQQDKAG